MDVFAAGLELSAILMFGGLTLAFEIVRLSALTRKNSVSLRTGSHTSICGLPILSF